ncbi:Rho GTPase-activating protein 27 [Mactra antiquata]
MAGCTNFTADNYPRVKVLYNYDYEDELDKTRVWMKEDEIFYLLNSDGGEWWQVCRPDSPQSPFYVPSTYVEVISNISGKSGLNDSYTQSQQSVEHVDKNSVNNRFSFESMETHNGVRKMSTFKGSTDSDDNDSDYVNAPAKIVNDPKVTNVQYIPNDAKRPADSSVDEDYVNLESFREKSGLPKLNCSYSTPNLQPQASDEGNYANLQELGLQDLGLQENPPIPDIEHSQYQKTLQDMWEVYLDSNSNRLFYVHKETKEKQWKPPRGHYHAELQKKRSTSETYEEIVLPDVTKPSSSKNRNKRISRSFDCGRPRILLDAPEGWTYCLTESGHHKLVNDQTKQEFGYVPQRSGGSTPTKSPTSENDPKLDFAQHMLQTSSKPSDRAQVTEVPADLSSNSEPIEGWLNKCKILNGKKASKKWVYTYVKLGGSNLVFYKDQKSAQPKSGSPHGKYEQIVSLATCSIDKDVEKITSKKHTLVITCDDSQILLAAEDDVKMQEWFVKIHTRIKELGGCPDTQGTNNSLSTDTNVNRKQSFSGKDKDKKHDRKPSDSGTLERKGKIKNVLERFMTTRSDKEKLVKKGIYKDAVFGADLKQICAKEKTRVPKFVETTIAAIEKRGLDHEGIYRVGGNVSQIQKVRMMVDQGEKYDANDPMWDVNVLTGSLKLFFRELKDPLFTCALFDKFLKSYLSEKSSDRLKGVKSTLEELPKPHYETIKMLFRHLIKVMELSSENKMTAHTLAIVFGPTLIWPEVQHQNLATSMVYQSRIVEYVLHEYKNLFR